VPTKGPEGQRRSRGRRVPRPQRRANKRFALIGLLLSAVPVTLAGRLLPWDTVGGWIGRLLALDVVGRWMVALTDKPDVILVIVAGLIVVALIVAVTWYATVRLKVRTEERQQERRYKFLETLDQRDRRYLVEMVKLLGLDRREWSDAQLGRALSLLRQPRSVEVLAKLGMRPDELILAPEVSRDGSFSVTQQLEELLAVLRRPGDENEESPGDNSVAR
jgi:hypothetical protein